MKRMVVLATICMTGVAAAGALGASSSLNPGVYSTKITGARVAPLNGSWMLALSGPAYTLARNKATAVAGTATIAGGKITFRDLAGPYRCAVSQASGTYKWTLKGKTLTFKPVSDLCVGRKSVLAHKFTKIT